MPLLCWQRVRHYPPKIVKCSPARSRGSGSSTGATFPSSATCIGSTLCVAVDRCYPRAPRSPPWPPQRWVLCRGIVGLGIDL
eukprot:gene56632-biopygen49097